jgi:hypothetical protein
MALIRVPPRLDTLAALRIAHAIAFSTVPEVNVDFSRLTIPEPFAMLYVACAARSHRERGGTFRLVGADEQSYAAYMGLFSEFDAAYPKRQSGVQENENYVAIRSISRAYLIETANEIKASHIGEVIESDARRFARLLTQTDRGPLVDALTYCLREIIRNGYEHSEASEVLVCGQYRPTSGRVDLAIADRGSGLLKTLSKNPLVRVVTEIEAVKVALLPGISGKGRPHGGRRRRSHDPWANTGYGLYMTHRVCREGGVFTICSGDALLRLSGDRSMERTADTVGTVVGLTMRLDTLQDLERKLPEFSAQGRVISRTLRGAIVTASTASISLRMTRDPEGP